MNEKLAANSYPIEELLRRRWSPRAFDERSVERDKLLSLLEAARWAPSCFNEQPWSFLVATKDQPEEFERLASCLIEGNFAWASKAPVLMLSVARLAFERGGLPNRHAQHDVGLAVENLVIEATALGLHVHQMAGFHIDRARQTFAIPEGCEPVAIIAVGYLGDPVQLPERQRLRELAPRTRRELSEFVFSGHFGNPWGPVKA